MMKKTIVFKKTAALVLALLMIVSTLVVLPFGASADVTATENWTVDSEGYYNIGSAADMLAFQTTTAAHAAGAKVRLTADIDMSGVNDWAPLDAFSGTFDGQGHTISNITVTNQAALFLTASGEIKNVTLDNCKVTSTTKFHNAIVVATGISAQPLTIDNVHVKNSELIRSDGTADIRRAGGIIGRTYTTTTVNNCSLIDSTIGFNLQGAGIVGYVTNSGTEVTKISNCYTNATINNGSTTWVGGIVGYMQSGKVEIENVVFAGEFAMTGGTTSYIGHVTQNDFAKVTNFVVLGTSCGFFTFESGKTIAAANLENCITAADLNNENTIATLKDAGWVTTGDKVTVNETEVIVLVPASVCAYFTCPIPTTDVYYQKKANGDGTVDIRFVAVINDLSYANVGFNVQATRGEGDGAQTSQKITKTTTTVYTSVTALGDNVTAESLGGQYIYVIEIKNVDVATYAHSFNVSAFVTVQDGTNQIVWEAATQTLTVAKAS